MGTGASKDPTVGVQLNPRVQYAGDLARQEGKDKLIDVPILVKLEHGTVRYRYQDGGHVSAPVTSLEDRLDKPHEGPERSKKHGYFFHATLNDFSEDATYREEQDWKFRYVCKGPASARQKKLFYVFGRGLQTRDGGLVRRPAPRPQGRGYSWGTAREQAGHASFNLTFLSQSTELGSDEDDDLEVPDILEDSVDVKMKDTTLQVTSTDHVMLVQKRMSIRVLKPPDHVHLFYSGEKLSPEQKMGDLRTQADANWKHFRILLRPK